MIDTPLYSVRQLANALSLPESTVRYYRDSYSSYLTVVGTGPRRLYPFDTLERLRVIKDGYARGLGRSAIEAKLSEFELPNGQSGNGSTSLAKYEDVLATILDGERERREAMWQVAREIVRLGEAIERQQVLLGAIAAQVGATERDARADAQTTDAQQIPVAEAATIDSTVEAELATLREQLAHERELVERLRRSKVEMERRAAEAEALLDATAGEDPSGRRKHILRRLLRRDLDE